MNRHLLVLEVLIFLRKLSSSSRRQTGVATELRGHMNTFLSSSLSSRREVLQVTVRGKKSTKLQRLRSDYIFLVFLDLATIKMELEMEESKYNSSNQFWRLKPTKIYLENAFVYRKVPMANYSQIKRQYMTAVRVLPQL